MNVNDRVKRIDEDGWGTVSEIYRGPHAHMRGMVKVIWDGNGGWTWELKEDLEKQ